MAVFSHSGAIMAVKWMLLSFILTHFLTNPFAKNNNFKPGIVQSEKQNRTS